MTILAVSLDLDGTLVDSIGDLAAAANAMRAELGLKPLPQSTLERYVGGGVARLVHRAITDDYQGEADNEEHQLGMDAFEHHYTRRLTATTRPYAGIVDGLIQLRVMEIRLACITNKPYRFAVPILEQTGLADYFELVLGGDSLPEKKPSPLPLLHTCMQFDIQPLEMLMVGDSHYDLEAARAAGCPVALFNYGYEDISPLEPDFKAASLVEIVDFVKNCSPST